MLPGLSPDWLFQVLPSTAVDQRKVDSFVVADVLADLIQGQPSSGLALYVRGGVGGQSGAWGRLGFDLKIQDAGFARFMPSGDVEAFPQSKADVFGGFYVIPTLRPLSSVMQGDSGTGTTLGWRATEGDWRTAPPLRGGRGNVIYTRSSGKSGVMTDRALSTNQAFETQFDFFGSSSATGDPNCFYDVGPNVRLALRQGEPPVLEKRLMTVEGGAVRPGNWDTWRRLSDEPFSPNSNQYRFSLSQTCGRMVAKWNDRETWLLDENNAQNSQSLVGQRARAAVPTWGGTPLRLNVNGCKVTAELATLDHLDDEGTAPRTTTITRRIPLAAAQSYQPRLLDPQAVGFVPPGGDMSVAVTHDEDSITVTTTIKAGDDGVLSPALSQVLLAYKPVWVNGTGSPINISSAVVDSTVTLAQPPSQAGSEASVSIDLSTLEKNHPQALALIKDFAPFQISARWKSDATGQPLSNYRGLMQGYLFGEEGAQPGYNDTTLTYSVRDDIVRLRDEAGIIGPEFYDLYLAYSRLTRESIGKALKELRTDSAADGYKNPFDPEVFIPVSAGFFYGADAAKEIIEIQLGPRFAAKFNGTGDSRRFLSKGHPPLLSALDVAGSLAPLASVFGQTLGIGSIGSAATGGFKPPYGKDCFSWLSDIKKDDFCEFWIGHTDRDTDSWPVPIYGVYEEYLNAAKGWHLDAAEAADVAGLIEGASYSTRPANAINRVLVWSNPFGDSQEIPGAPSLIQGEARIARGANAPQNSWTRTKVLNESFANWATTPAQASNIASTFLLETNGDNPFFPVYEMRGDARWLVGDVFWATGLRLNINNIYCRAARIEHRYKSDPDTGRWWTTAVSLQPMTRSQIVRFCRNNNLPIPAR